MILHMDWTEKYRPRTLQDLVGNAPAVRQIYEWARSWTRRSPPLILYGKPGVGKTSSAHALAHDMGWEIVELNASDQRTKAALDRIAGTSSATASLLGAERKLILLDEADNLHGTADRGGARAIIDIIKNSRQPIILIANDLYGIAKEIKALGEPVQFRAVQARSIVPRLREICRAEGLSCTEDALVEIAESAGGDLRAAVNMLCAAGVGRERIAAGDISTAQKDERSTIFDLVAAIFSGKPDLDLMAKARQVEDTPDAMVQWIEGNLPAMKDQKAVVRAYRPLSRADEWIGLTTRRQYYILWRYATAMMTLGVKVAAGGAGVHDRIMPPSRWRKMGSARKGKAVRESVMQKLSRSLSLPQHTIREEYLTLIALLVDENPEPVVRELALDADELNFFIHNLDRAKKVVKEMKAAEKPRKKKDVKKEEAIPEPEPEPAPAPVPDDPPAEEKKPAATQSTLFDSF
jgi:replication factor C large subunit